MKPFVGICLLSCNAAWFKCLNICSRIAFKVYWKQAMYVLSCLIMVKEDSTVGKNLIIQSVLKICVLIILRNNNLVCIHILGHPVVIGCSREIIIDTE